MNRVILLLIAAVVLQACQQHTKFRIEGRIANATDKTLYFEHSGLSQTTVLDSVTLDADGSFSFKSNRPAYPDFYRLRIDDKFIHLAIDSTETLTIKADLTNFATGYTIEGSQANTDILKLRSSVSAIQAKLNSISPNMSTEARSAKIVEIETAIDKHKAMAKQLILANPRSSVAYFAIFQKINNTYLFSPYVKDDKPFCAAVATAYNVFMPEYNRTKHLYALVVDAIKNERREIQKANWQSLVDSASTGYIEIALNDRNGKLRKLSELEGKVVLIDFSAFEMENNVAYTFELRELHNKFRSRGFEIFQVSLDRSKLLWEEATANVPWVSVRDDNGQQSEYIRAYNVNQIPTLFVMDKKGVIVSRAESFKTAASTIESLL